MSKIQIRLDTNPFWNIEILLKWYLTMKMKTLQPHQKIECILFLTLQSSSLREPSRLILNWSNIFRILAKTAVILAFQINFVLKTVTSLCLSLTNHNLKYIDLMHRWKSLVTSNLDAWPKFRPILSYMNLRKFPVKTQAFVKILRKSSYF